MISSSPPKFVILAILDGWGISSPNPGNAITLANTVNINKFIASYPHTQLAASGEAVGLPRGEDGNTETGHLNLGAGRIIYQDLERINMSIADGSFLENPTLIKAIEYVKEQKTNLHFMGLVGAGGVHSNIEHLFALIQLAANYKVENLYLHLFTDGRDSPPTAAKTYINSIQKVIDREKIGKIASVMGRYWAMDRDERWDRIEKAYVALTEGRARQVHSPEEAIELSYADGKTDEFIEPSIVVDENNKPITLISDRDAVIFFNFRIDRPRELTQALIYEDFSRANEKTDSDGNKKSGVPFTRTKRVKDLLFITMTEYSGNIKEAGAIPAFPPEIVDMPLAQIISNSNLRQLHITESEKERFVTFYFNGLREKPFPGEDWHIVPSPKVLTYDQKPEMSAYQITDDLIEKLKTNDYSFVVLNYPNADMVGHTGNIGPAVKAIEVIDECIGKLANFVLAYDGVLLITADHGNAEEMINLTSNEIDTEHSTNPVPFIVVGDQYLGKTQALRSGILADVVPTILALLNIPIPENITGSNLLQEISQD